MAAPVKDTSDQTGNFKGLSVIVVALLIFAGILLYATKLPERFATQKAPIALQDPQPQVAGESDIAEFVPPEEIVEETQETVDTQQVLYPVTAVSDGDTIKVVIDGKQETVRLIGVDTPETKDPRKPVQCYGQVASAYTTNMVMGKSVRLESDDSQQQRDKYGRLLRYVYLSDGTLINQLLIESGHAYEYTYKVPNHFQSQFKQAATDAQANQIGLWNPKTCNGQK